MKLLPACTHPYWRHCRRKPHEDDPEGEAAKMTATLSIVRGGAAEIVACESEQLRNDAAEAPEKAWDAQQFAQEQIRGLVRRVFLQRWPRPARQVVFSSAGSQVEVASVCRKAGAVLAAERAGRVVLVEADVRTKALERSFGRSWPVLSREKLPSPHRGLPWYRHTRKPGAGWRRQSVGHVLSGHLAARK